MKKHWLIGLAGCLLLSGSLVQAAVKVFSFDSRMLTLESVGIEEEKLTVVVDGFSNEVNFGAGGIVLPAHAFAIANGKHVDPNEVQMDAHDNMMKMTFKMEYTDLPDEIYLYKDTKEDKMLIWSNEDTAGTESAGQEEKNQEETDQEQTAFEKLAGEWSGTGVSPDGGAEISLQVEILEDGSGSYQFEQAGYIENYPFTLDSDGEHFSVSIPANNLLSIVSCEGTYSFGDDSVLILEITTTFANGRQFRYSAELERAEVETEEADQTPEVAEAESETEATAVESEETAQTDHKEGLDRSKTVSGVVGKSSAQDLSSELGVSMQDGIPIYEPGNPCPLNAYMVTREDCMVGINHDNMYSVKAKGLHEGITTPMTTLARLIEEESLNAIRFVEDPQDADILLSVSQQFDFYGNYSGGGLNCKVYSSTFYLTGICLTDTNQRVSVQKTHTPGNTVTTSGGTTVWMNPPDFEGSEELQTLVNQMLEWYGYRSEKGSRGDGVRRAQQALIDRGFLDGTADGVFGEKTATAVKLLQEQYGLEQTGSVNKATLTALYYDQNAVDEVSNQ